VDLPDELLGVGFVQGRELGEAGVVDEHVNAEIAGCEFGGQLRSGAGDRQVHRDDVDRVAAAAQLGGERFELCLRAGGQYEVRAPGAELAGEHLADPGRRAGNQRAGPFEFHRVHLVASFDGLKTLTDVLDPGTRASVIFSRRAEVLAAIVERGLFLAREN
jgi:hypothetical protein